MTDEQDTGSEVPAKRQPGRPRGSTKRRTVAREPMHRGPRHDDGQDPLEGFEYRPHEHENPLSIDLGIVRSIEREWGYSLLWVCFEAAGKPFPALVNTRKRNGYCEVRKGNFGGCLDHMCDKNDGGIRHEGLVLMARPMQIQRMAQAHDKRAAKDAIAQMQASHKLEGVSGITMPEGNVAHARAKNTHKRSFEPGPIPE
jgi:hypothetical protein